MTNEEKQLLLKDLCAREPYHPRIQVFNQGYEGFRDGVFDTSLWLHHIDAFRFDRIEILPYLRPMSSMTQDEAVKYITLTHYNTSEDGKPYRELTLEALDWLNAHHFDYRGLIEKGLALEGPEGMYKND